MAYEVKLGELSADDLRERVRDLEAEAEHLLTRYLRLQEAVVEETGSLPMVRSRILAVCE